MLSKLPMRQGVGVIVLNQNNQVFVAKRKDNPVDKWQMPQGGIDYNETPFNESAFTFYSKAERPKNRAIRIYFLFNIFHMLI